MVFGRDPFGCGARTPPAAPPPIYDPWNHRGGPRPAVPDWIHAPEGKSLHHAPRPDDERAMSFGGVAFVIPYALYDTIEIGPEGARHARETQWAPLGHWRLFMNPTGKTIADIAPPIATGGFLSAPRCFDARRLQVLYRPCVTWRELARDGSGHVLERHADAVDLAKARADIAALRALPFRFQVGIKDYMHGELGDLPWPLNVFLPPQQGFFGALEVHALPHTYVWRVRVRIEGFIGLEVA